MKKLFLLTLCLCLILTGCSTDNSKLIETKDAIESYLNEQGFESYRVEITNNALGVYVAMDGIENIADSIKPKNEDSNYLAVWNDFKDSMLDFYNSVESCWKSSGVSVVFNIIGDIDNNKTIFTIIDGKVTYDYVLDEADGVSTEVTKSTEQTVTTGMKNALKAAKNYLSIMPFSYEGLIEQLEYEQYTHSEAVYAADNCGADWKEQAAKKAAAYLDIMAFSREGLIEQLEYEGFTHEQAVYGVEQNGY